MLESPKISVIIPVYNAEKYLKECLGSILNNTLKDIEVICVDDGSTDNSLKMLKEYSEHDKRIRILTQENSGAAIARNAGIEAAEGQYLYFLDSDDFVDNNIFEKLYKQITKYNADICLCGRKNYDEQTKITRIQKEAIVKHRIPNKKCFTPLDVKNNLLQICSIACFTKLYKSEFIQRNNIRFQNLRTCNDVFFNFSTLILASSITYVDEPLVISRRNRIGALSSNRGNYCENIVLALKATMQLLVDKNLFDTYKEMFYKKAVESWWFEQHHTTPINKLKLAKQIKEFLPFKYKVILDIKYMGIILPCIFSVRNINKNNKTVKVLTLCGLSFKIKELTSE